MPKTNSAFSLMEITVTVVLVGIVAALALPNYSKAIAKTDERNAIVNLQAIRAGMRAYLANTGDTQIPTTWDGLDVIGAELGLSLTDARNTLYQCVATATTNQNRCRVELPDSSRLHFHLDGPHNTDGSIHCSVAPCPSCPSNPGDCG